MARKNINNIILIGFMASGKTHAASLLAKKLGWRELDSDSIIERREKKSVAKIFEDKGESYFRTLESKVIKDILLKPEAVLSFGGGVVCRKVNRVLIKKRGFVVWLRVSPETVIKRIKDLKTRPLLNVENPQKVVRELMKERESYYRQCATVSILNNSGDILKKLLRVPQIKAILREQKKPKKTSLFF